MEGVGGGVLKRATGGKQEDWERWGQVRDRRQDTLGGGEGARAVNWGVGKTDGELMMREC